MTCELDPREVWEAILGGKSLEIVFPNSEEAERFRLRLAQIKARSEEKLVSIGFMTEGEKQSLRFQSKADVSKISLEDGIPYHIYLFHKTSATFTVNSFKILDS